MGMFPKDLDHYIASHKTIQEFNTIEMKENIVTFIQYDYKKVI